MLKPSEIQASFEQYLRGQVKNLSASHDLYAPIEYLMTLKAKRVRPVVALLAYQAVAGAPPGAPAYDLGLSLELLHNFTLIHDDIMDRAPVRRGQPTVHEKWDENTAILSGDALFAISMQYLAAAFPAQAAALVAEYTRVTLGVCEGQMEDMQMAEAETATIAEYIEMIRKKTAMLIGGSMSMGAIAAGAGPDLVQKFYDFGETAGIGFQLQDDYLDVFAHRAKFGKQVAGDILENKKTYLLLKARELADPAQQVELNYLLESESDPDKKIGGVKRLYDKLGIAEITKVKIRDYFTQSMALLNEIEAVTGETAMLRGFFDALMEREF